MRNAWLFAVTVALGIFMAPHTARAQSPVGSAPETEKCIAYRDSGDGRFRLVNECDFPVTVSWCQDASPVGNECARNIGWRSDSVAARADMPGQFAPLQSISLFACREPGIVRIIGGTRAICDSAPVANAMPLLPGSALKNGNAIVTASDLPTHSMVDGTTRFEMLVGADGRPGSCSVTATSGDAAIDKITCNLFLRRARFTPAKDSNGKAVSARYRGSVTWKAP